MGMTSALKLRKIVDNLELLIAIELMCAAQGLEYRLPLKPGLGVQKAFEAVRRVVPHLEADRPLGRDIEGLANSIREGRLA
jgi:histidine ammonia-lyase